MSWSQRGGRYDLRICARGGGQPVGQAHDSLDMLPAVVEGDGLSRLRLPNFARLSLSALRGQLAAECAPVGQDALAHFRETFGLERHRNTPVAGSRSMSW